MREGTVPMARGSRPKVKIGISLDADLYEWIVARTGTGGEFASISHAIERCVVSYQREGQPGRRAHAHADEGHDAAHT